MNFSKVPQLLSIVRFAILASWLALTPIADAEDRGVIHDADGFVNVRAKPTADAPAIAQVKRGELTAPDDDAMADRYLIADEMLRAHGLHWYEISNWAADPSAASSDGSGVGFARRPAWHLAAVIALLVILAIGVALLLLR